MRLAILQHVPFEGPAGIADWAISRRVPMSIASLYEGDSLPELSSFDMLAIMGGPMSANDEPHYPWLSAELARVRDAIEAGKIVLGVCLGAQIIAKALGAKVYSGSQKEIGWFPVERTAAAHASFEGVPACFAAFHWHGETFDLPAGGTGLAKTAATPNQAFAFGTRVLGLQFHLESTHASVQALLGHAAGDIGAGPYEQSPGAILAGVDQCESLRPVLNRILDNLTGTAGAGK